MNALSRRYSQSGYAVAARLLNAGELASLRLWVSELITRHRCGEAAVVAESVSIAEVSRQHPQRNADVEGSVWDNEPYIIGNPMALDSRFAALLGSPAIWNTVARLLDQPVSEVVFHFCNLTRKPKSIGPAMGWHRDSGNQYFDTDDGRTLRLLIPLQPMNMCNGGTSLVPGSHLHASRGIEHAVCPHVPAGGGLFLHSGVLHGGGANRSDGDRDVIVLQFGLRSSRLRCQAQETLALLTYAQTLAFIRQQET